MIVKADPLLAHLLCAGDGVDAHANDMININLTSGAVFLHQAVLCVSHRWENWSPEMLTDLPEAT